MAAKNITKSSRRKITSSLRVDDIPASVPELPHYDTGFKKHPRIGLTVIALLAIAAIVYFGRGLVVAAVVNNKPIFRLDLIRNLEKSQGSALLQQKVKETLIFQEAKRRNIEISPEEIDEEIKKLEEEIKTQGQDLNQLLAQQGMVRDDLYQQYRLKIVVEKIITPDINVSDEDISKYFDENKSYYPEDTKLDGVKEEIKDTITQQQLSEKFASWLEELESKAKIYYFADYYQPPSL